MAVKDWLKKEAPNWAQSLPGGNRSKVPSAKVFTTALTKAPVLDKAKNIKSPGLRVVASLGEGFVNTPSNIVRSYGRTVNDIRGGAPIKRTIGDAGELALNMASFVPIGKGFSLAKQGFRQGAARVPNVYPLVKEGIRYGAKSGGLYGAGYGATQSLQNEESIPQILKNTAIGGGTGTVVGGLVGGLSAGAPAIYNAFKNRKSVGELIPRHEVPVGIFDTGFEQDTANKLRGLGYQVKVVHGVGKGKSSVSVTIPEQVQNGQSRLQDVLGQVGEAFPRPGMSVMDVSRKQRGFAETVAQSQMTNKKVVSMLQDANYTPQKNDELVRRATSIVENDIDRATDIALNGDDNMSIATASELIKKFQNDGNFTAAANLTKEVAAKLTEAGRYIQAASLYNRLTPQGIVRYAQQELSKEGLTLNGGQAKVLTDLAKKAGSLKGEEQVIATQKMLDKVREMIPSKFADQLVTVWKAGLLTNPTTHIANVGGNTTMLGLETLKDYPATVLDAIASLATGKRTKTTPSYRAIGSGVVSGAKKAFTYAKTGVDVDETLGKIDYKKVNLPPVIKQYTEFVFRMLGATDKFFKETLLKKSLMEQAKVDGINRGLSGKALRDHANNLFQNPSIDMVKNATEEALYGTFNSRNALTEKLGNSAAVNVVAPFKRTPTNIGARILDYSPYGIGKGFVQGVKGNQKGFAENVARGAIGTGIGALGYGLGKAGQMTGNYPSNETERALWEAEGRQPGALKVGGSYYGLNRISPVGNILATGAGMADLGRIKPENVPGAMAAVAGKNLLGQTYLQGVSGALNALQDPNRSAATWVENLAKGVIPSIIGAGARAIDPYQRQVNSIGEAVQSRIPGLSQNLLPKVDAFGRKLQNESNPFFDPFNTKKDKSDQTTKEIWRLYKNYSGVSLGKPNESVSLGKGLKIDLTPEEFTAYQQRTGGVFKPLLDQVISSKDYRAMSDYDKAKTINNVISKVRQLWVIQNASSLENKGGLLQQIQEQVKLRTPAFYTR